MFLFFFLDSAENGVWRTRFDMAGIPMEPGADNYTLPKMPFFGSTFQSNDVCYKYFVENQLLVTSIELFMGSKSEIFFPKVSILQI